MRSSSVYRKRAWVPNFYNLVFCGMDPTPLFFRFSCILLLLNCGVGAIVTESEGDNTMTSKPYYLVSATSTEVLLNDGRHYSTNRLMYFSCKAKAVEIAEQVEQAARIQVKVCTPRQANKPAGYGY